MIVKSKRASRLVPEGPHVAKLVAVAGKPNDAEPKKVILRFKVEGHDDEVTKQVPVSFEQHAPLRHDAETLLGRQLTANEAEDGIDLQSLVGKAAQIVVGHKPGVGGKPTATATLIQPVPPEDDSRA